MRPLLRRRLKHRRCCGRSGLSSNMLSIISTPHWHERHPATKCRRKRRLRTSQLWPSTIVNWRNGQMSASRISQTIARLEAREIDAERLYERAIRLAREQGFVQNEGLAYELASRFYAARGFDVIADAYLRAARQCHFRWGALV